MKIEKENLETIKPDLSPLFYEMRELDSLNNEKTEKVIEAFKDAEVKNWPDGSWGTFYLVTSGNLYEQLKSLGLDESSTLSFKAYRELSNLEQKENKTMDDYSKISQIKSRNLDVLDNVDNLLKKYDIGRNTGQITIINERGEDNDCKIAISLGAYNGDMVEGDSMTVPELVEKIRKYRESEIRKIKELENK